VRHPRAGTCALAATSSPAVTSRRLRRGLRPLATKLPNATTRSAAEAVAALAESRRNAEARADVGAANPPVARMVGQGLKDLKLSSFCGEFEIAAGPEREDPSAAESFECGGLFLRRASTPADVDVKAVASAGGAAEVARLRALARDAGGPVPRFKLASPRTRLPRVLCAGCSPCVD
jgi:hypothetical protein